MVLVGLWLLFLFLVFTKTGNNWLRDMYDDFS